MAENKVRYEKTDVLLGDGNAMVERTRYAKHGVGYGAFAISGSCTVSLRCNQDDKTILAAIEKAGFIANQVMKKDNAEMSRIADKMAEELGA